MQQRAEHLGEFGVFGSNNTWGLSLGEGSYARIFILYFEGISEFLNGPSVPAWALGLLALSLITTFACIFGLWRWKSQKDKDK